MSSVLGGCWVPVEDGSDPRSEVDLWTSGRGPKALQRSTVPPPATPPPADSLMSMLLLLEELSSDPAPLNQLLQTRTRRVYTSDGDRVCARTFTVPPLLLGGAVRRGGRRGLGGGGRSLLPGLQTLDLQLLRCDTTPF